MAGPLSTHRWQQLRRSVIAESEPYCAACGRFVDKTIPGRQSQGPSVDHRIPREKGGGMWDRSNLALVHYGCNSRKKDRLPRKQSRRW